MSKPTDREIIIACFNAIGALARRLTGERLFVDLRLPDGTETKVYADEFSAAFSAKEEHEAPSVPLVTEMSTPDDHAFGLPESHLLPDGS